MKLQDEVERLKKELSSKAVSEENAKAVVDQASRTLENDPEIKKQSGFLESLFQVTKVMPNAPTREGKI